MFPFDNCVEPELDERKRSGEFRAGELDDVGIFGEVIQAFANVGAVKSAADRVRDVVKLFGHEDAFVTRIGRRFRKSGAVDVVGGTPWKIGPVRARFEDVVLKIVLMD